MFLVRLAALGDWSREVTIKLRESHGDTAIRERSLHRALDDLLLFSLDSCNELCRLRAVERSSPHVAEAPPWAKQRVVDIADVGKVSGEQNLTAHRPERSNRRTFCFRIKTRQSSVDFNVHDDRPTYTMVFIGC
jgi:hypothetical protein